MDHIPFGTQLRQWRKANHIKQAAIAHDLNVTQAAISRWENGVDEPCGQGTPTGIEDMLIPELVY